MDRRTLFKASVGAIALAPSIAIANELPMFVTSGTIASNLVLGSTGQISGDISATPTGVLPMRRYVKVIIVDPNESVPVDKAVLYNGAEMLTDMTDQELYFSLPTPLSQMLETHNKYRVTCVNKARTDKEVMLEPARIRDIKMVVQVIASF